MDDTLKLFICSLVLTAIVLLPGCPGPVKPEDPGVIAKGMSDITSASAALKSHRLGVKALSSGGKLKYIYFKDGKPKEENFDANLRFDPPRRLYFAAKSLVGEAIRLGSNDEEFWLQMKPKESWMNTPSFSCVQALHRKLWKASADLMTAEQRISTAPFYRRQVMFYPIMAES